MRIGFILYLAACVSALAQVPASEQKGLNASVDYANQSAAEITSVVKSLIDYYPQLHRKASWGTPHYGCPIQLDDYYYINALKSGSAASVPQEVITALKALRETALAIDAQCKALDTYHKLEDYKQDNFKKAEELVATIGNMITTYRSRQQDLQSKLESAFQKLTGSNVNYAKADKLMRAQIAREKNVLDSWTFNLAQDTHTGFPVDKLQESIPVTDRELANLKTTKLELKYPASSMWPHFQESLGSFLETKRSGLDGYNVEAKKSDRHSNELYLALINYFNGALVADHNAFLQFSERDNYFGLKSLHYVPSFEVRTRESISTVEVKPFTDIPRQPLQPAMQKTLIGKQTFDALSNYVAFINETGRQTSYMQDALRSFNSSASYYRSLENFDRKGAMHFDFKDYQIPLSAFQKAVSDGQVLPSTWAKSLNDQAQVLLNVLKEMEELSASLENEVKEKRYEKDHLDHVYKILERQSDLLLIWDDKKEMLYEDVRHVFEAFIPTNPTSSWYRAGKALRDLSDLDHDALFIAKKFYKGDSTLSVKTEKIDQSLRDVIGQEYENMKGIQKYGRSNGLCPYTPYEDLPETSKRLSEQLKQLKPSKKSGYEHPYHTLIYMYNDIIEDYNKFCELSTSVPHLKSIFQPELFSVQYPVSKPGVSQNIVASNEAPTQQNAVSKQNTSQTSNNNTIVSNKRVIHDTIYIEKRDTIYLHEPSENLRSMEGYATNNMVLLLDVSGSMNQPDKLPLLKASVLNMVSMMRQEDQISIIAFSAKPKVVLKSSSFVEREKIQKAINELSSSGKTDGNAGLKVAYKVADENYVRGGNNRIILATDGEFQLDDESRKLIQTFSGQDIFLTVFNFGKGMNSSNELEKLAALGKGNYESISKDNVELKLIREAKAKRRK